MANSSFYDFHCPLGGKWYACASGSNFVGCCTADPCANGCPQGNVQPGAFNSSHHGEFPDASCGTGSRFYSCGFAGTFWGCCKTNACQATPPATCASGNLTSAYMSLPEEFSAYASPGATSSSKKSNTGAIAGGVVGGVVGLAIIGALIFFFLRRRKANRKTDETGVTSMMPMANEKHHSQQPGAQSPPPTYSAPSQDFYQSMSPDKGHQSYHQYASYADEPQELPAEASSSSKHRYSELPAGVGSSQRYSELPTEADTHLAELESPRTSPRPLQSEFSTDMAKRSGEPQGLGVRVEGASQEH